MNKSNPFEELGLLSQATWVHLNTRVDLKIQMTDGSNKSSNSTKCQQI